MRLSSRAAGQPPPRRLLCPNLPRAAHERGDEHMECKGSQAAAVKAQACECEHARVRCQEVGKANGLPGKPTVDQRDGACGCAIRKSGSRWLSRDCETVCRRVQACARRFKSCPVTCLLSPSTTPCGPSTQTEAERTCAQSKPGRQLLRPGARKTSGSGAHTCPRCAGALRRRARGGSRRLRGPTAPFALPKHLGACVHPKFSN